MLKKWCHVIRKNNIRLHAKNQFDMFSTFGVNGIIILIIIAFFVKYAILAILGALPIKHKCDDKAKNS